jgi:hypothetical protein
MTFLHRRKGRVIAALGAVVLCGSASADQHNDGHTTNEPARMAFVGPPAPAQIDADHPLANPHPALKTKSVKARREGPKRTDQPAESMSFFLAQRLAPGMTQYPIERVRATAQEMAFREARLGVARTQPGGIVSWTELGPGNIGGRTRAIVIDPNDPTTIYAGGVSGGIWKTTDADGVWDANDTWTALDDSMLNLAITTIVMDPNDSDTLYAGTGEGYYNFGGVRGLGIFKTTDAGATWTQLPSTNNSDFYYVNDVVISPNDSNRLYAATRAGVYVSNDAGATWTQTRAGTSFVGCTEIAVRQDTGPDDVVFAAFGSFVAEGLFRSTDSGATWTQLGTSTDLQVANQGRMALAIAPSDNDTIYVSMADNGDTGNPTGTLVNVLRSTDGGATWSNRLNLPDPNDINPWLLSNHVFANACANGTSQVFSQGWYDNVIAVDPVNADRVWVGGIDLFRSDDGGQNFELTSYWYLDDDGIDSGLHADQHAIVFHPNYNGTTNRIVYFGNDGGVYRTEDALAPTATNGCPFDVNFDLDETQLADTVFDDLNTGYGVTQIYNGDSAVGVDRIAGGCQDNGTVMLEMFDSQNAWVGIFGGDGGYVEIDPTNPDVLYIETQNFPNIRKSTDGGVSFADAVTGITDTDGLFITPFEMDPSNELTLWTGGSRAWRTTDGAANWVLASANVADPFPQGATISAIGVAPSDSNVVYLGFNNGVVAKSVNALANPPAWTESGPAEGLPTGWVSSIAVDPTNSAIAYATYSTFDIDHILKTIDGGATWTSVDGIAETGIPDIPVHWLAIKPDDASILYAGTEVGVFVSENAATTWAPANLGLPRTVVETIDFPSASRMFAYTYGRGAWAANFGVDCNENLIDDSEEARPTLYVDVSATGAGDGSSWADAYNDLQSALCIASSTGLGVVLEILVAEGSYRPDTFALDDRTATFELVGSVAIRGGFPSGGGVQNPTAHATILTGEIGAPGVADNSFNIVSALSPTVSGAVLEGFIITGANGANQGGGVYANNASQLLVQDCRIDENSATFGGGAAIVNARVDFVSCSFGANSAGNGGAVDNFADAKSSFTNCTFLQNSASNAGGALSIFGVGTTVRVSNSSFTNNDALTGAGVVGWGGARAFVVDSTFQSNMATNGGAVASIQPNTRTKVSQSQIIANTASNNGGGLYCDDGATLIVSESLLTTNAASNFGGGAMALNATLNAIDCDFDANSAFNAGGGVLAQASTLNLKDADFDGNAAGASGGGVYLFGATGLIVQSRFFDNEASGSGTASTPFGGGAVAVSLGSSATIVASTLAMNRTTGTGPIDAGGGVIVFDGSTLELANTILWGNTSANGALTTEDAQVRDDVSAAANVISAHHSLVEGWSGAIPGVSTSGDDPRFVDMAGGDLRLGVGSAAIDAADASVASMRDALMRTNPGCVESGFELAIDLVEIDWDGGPISVTAFIGGFNSDYLSNQVTGGFDPNSTFGMGTNPEFAPFDFSDVTGAAGSQFVEVIDVAPDAAIVIDGLADDVDWPEPVYANGSIFGGAANPTGFGDNSLSDAFLADGSEMDAVRAFRTSSTLYLHIAGNFETNYNKLEIFIDCKQPGPDQNPLPTTPNPAYAGLVGYADSVFDLGFNPDYHLRLNQGVDGALNNEQFLDAVQLAGSGTTGGGDLPGAKPIVFLGPNLGVGGDDIGADLDNRNVGGVTGPSGADFDGLQRFVDAANYAESGVADGFTGATPDIGAYEADAALAAPALCPGDIDGDGDTDLGDFTILAMNFGASGLPFGDGESLGLGDLNDDGSVNLADFTLLAMDFGCAP